ncbi:MAG TPA: ABC transporter substrate-binding protein [Acidimicrobiia bacterium]
MSRAFLGVAVAALLVAAVLPATAGARAHHAQQPGSGNLTFGLEAETTDYCLPRAQLAISGIQVVGAIYDTLTVPNSKGEIVPYLAKSVEPDSTFTTWTITLRPGITFHDGTALDADAVKLNLDSYRGAPGAPNSGDLFLFYFNFIEDVQVVDPMTVKVVLKTPITDFPTYLFAEGRLGIVAPAQLNAGEDCSTKLIGTGPFELSEYKQNERTVVTRNPSYWQKGYPKAGRITFVPVPENSARVIRLQGGQVDIMHTDNGVATDTLRGLGKQVKRLTQKPGFREIHYYFLLSGNAPFDDPSARKAFALAIDRAKIAQIRTKGVFQVASSLMDRGAPGYLANAGYPKHDVKKARQLADEYKAAHGGTFRVILGGTQDQESSNEMQLVKEELAAAGIDAEIALFDQATQINKALSGDISVLDWRNLHGCCAESSDESTYIWFANYDTGNLVNFGHFSDPATQAPLDEGRGLTDKSAITKNYQAFNRAMAKQGYLLPMWYVDWTIGYAPNVKLTFPPLPDGNGTPLFVYGRIPVLGLSTT